MKPLIKYTGGKYKEYDSFKEHIPKEINNYYEPFFGGGGVMFRLLEDNKIKGSINVSDISEDLIEFYNSVGKEEIKTEVKKIEEAWESIHNISNDFCKKFEALFFDVILGKKNIKEFINDKLKEEIKVSFEKHPDILKINYHGFSLSNRIYDSIFDKTKKFIKKSVKDDDKYVSCKSLETSIHQGFYFTIRDMYNDWLTGNKDKYTIYERSAQWFYIREFCFGAMFRFGKNGKFNIPYGGYVYNSKNFSAKVNNLLSEETKEIFKRIKFDICDFEKALEKKYEEDDFIFLDPPYDSIFSEYDNNSFSREDHKRLHDVLENTKCKWLMVIGKTDFIYNLYKGFNITEYNKTYMYQARGEYESKHTSHLIIKNF